MRKGGVLRAKCKASRNLIAECHYAVSAHQRYAHQLKRMDGIFAEPEA